MILAKAFIYKPGKVSPVELLGISLVLVKVHLFSTQVLADWPPKKKPSYIASTYVLLLRSELSVVCTDWCYSWTVGERRWRWNAVDVGFRKNLPLLEYEKISNPVWEHHDSSNFYRKFFAKDGSNDIYLDGLKCSNVELRPRFLWPAGLTFSIAFAAIMFALSSVVLTVVQLLTWNVVKKIPRNCISG